MTAPNTSLSSSGSSSSSKQKNKPNKLFAKLFGRRRHSAKAQTALDDTTTTETTTASVRIVVEDNNNDDDFLLSEKMRLLLGETAPATAPPPQAPITAQPTRRSTHKPQKTVHFAEESVNTVIPSSCIDDSSSETATTAASLWYSESEILTMQRHFHDLMHTLRIDYKHQALLSSSTCWMGHLKRVYQNMCTKNTTTVPERRSSSSKGDCSSPKDMVLGAERCAVPGVLADIASRRRKLVKATRQGCLYLTNDAVAQQCRTLSLPSRLYARYLADQVALSLLEDE